MSWSDVFPILTEEMLEEFQAKTTKVDRNRYEDWFGVQRILPAMDRPMFDPKRRRHIVSATLFWKCVMGTDPDLPRPTRERLVMAKRLGLVKRFSPWESYVEPLIRWSPQAMRRHPEVCFRLYLANDLDFLVPELTALGWEIHLMKSSSVRYCPGGFWRFLALEEEGALVSVIDTDRMNEVDGEIARTPLMHERKLGVWRVPGYCGKHSSGPVYSSEATKSNWYPLFWAHYTFSRVENPLRNPSPNRFFCL